MHAAAAAAKSLQLCLTLCDPIDGSPPDSPVPRILQARTLEWAAVSFSNAWKWKVKVKSLSRVRFFATPWTAAYQALRPWDFPGKSTGVQCHHLLWHECIREIKFKINSQMLNQRIWDLPPKWISWCFGFSVFDLLASNEAFIHLIWLSFLIVPSWVECLSAQSCLTLCDPKDCSLPGSSVHGIF